MATTKKQRQRFIVSGIVALVLVALFWWLGLGPVRTKTSALNEQVVARRKTSEELTQLLQQAAKVEAEYEAVRKELTDVMTRQVPPDGNPMAWVGEAVRRAAQNAGITDDYRAISETASGGTRSALPARQTKTSMLESYEVKIDLQCGYHRFGHFLANLERDVPYVGIQGLSMVPGMDKSGRLKVSVRCYFPRFRVEGFAPEARPDRETPRVPKKVVAGAKPATGKGDEL